MGKVIRLTRSRSKTWATKRIQRLWHEGIVEFSPHATKRLQERGLDANDIQHVVRYGTVIQGGSSDFPATPRRFILEGNAVDGELMVCVVDIDGSLVVVTAYPKN